MRFDSARFGQGEAIFVTDQAVMSNNPVPKLTVDKPEFEETQESQRDNNILIDVLAELQGNLFYENILLF